MGCLVKLIGYYLLGIVIAKFFGDIDPEKTYTWYSGIWHGMIFIPNLVRSWFGDALYKANYYTTGYNIWWWILVVVNVWQALFGGYRR